MRFNLGDSVALSDGGAIFQQLQALPATTEDIAKIAGLAKNPLTGELKTAGDKLLGEIKNTALDVGKKILKGAVSTGVSAVTSLTVGASIGNLIPIPGIGAAIGAIGALVWEGLKALGKALLKFFRPAPQPYQTKCSSFDGCPAIPPMPIVDLIPWLGPQRVIIQEKLAEKLQKNYCGYGGIQDCASDLGYFWREAFDVTVATVPYLGLPQIDRLLIAYRATPTQFKQLNRRNQIEYFTASEPSQVIFHLESRRKKLVALMARAQQAATMPLNQVPALRWDLASELTVAASQVQVSPGPEAVSWYKILGDAVLLLTAREKADADRAAQFSQEIQARAAEVAADPRRKLQNDLDIARMQCGEGIQAKCDEAKRLQAQLQAMPTTAAPAATAARPAPVILTKPAMSAPKKLVLVAGGTAVGLGLLALFLRKPL